MMDHPVAAPLSETINHSERILDELCINAIRVLAIPPLRPTLYCSAQALKWHSTSPPANNSQPAGYARGS